MSTQIHHSPTPHLLAKPSFRPPFLTIPEFNLNVRASLENVSESTVASINNLAHYLQDDIEFTNKDLEALERLEEVLTQERIIKQNHEKDLLRIKNNMENIMASQHPLHIKVKLMGSMSESLRTKMDCIRECNKAYKEKILRLERAWNYMLALNIIRAWIRSSQIDVDSSQLDECFRISTTSNTIPFLTESRQTEENNDDDGLGEALENERVMHNKLEHVIISLKQIKIPIMIAYENTKDDYHVLQNLLKERKAILEQKLRDIEDLKRKVTSEEVTEYNHNNKENINPQLSKSSTPRNKLRDVYLGFEDKSQDLGGSRMALSTLSQAKTPKKAAPSKISQVFGKLFGGSKSSKKVVEKSLPTEDLNVSEVYIPTA